MVLAWCQQKVHSQRRGFTLIEVVVVLAILGILIALALPRYVASMKSAYKAEARNILQEAKTLQWAYYQQLDTFDTSTNMAQVGLAMPAGSHWHQPQVMTGMPASIVIMMSGAVSPLTAMDSVWVTVSGDGSATGGASF